MSGPIRGGAEAWRAKGAPPYGGLLEALIGHLDSALAKLKAVHNFELGAEFELAMCSALRAVLPARFGVCRDT